ncbi:transcription elongation factor GreAB [Mycobacterium alsense]|uniref:GreA/GreB family elongation factor n=1 Tax=Mycobacterium alsense TaxID=324058 RepID=A0AA42BXR9_9MYCO|nr:GreA/GreB family elongation factor [Mycobacterium alsense]MCV7378491.1 GreA/GreB family elongation factor [Mycobacterium alsense]OQZ90907.1 transcription elongation factor GreAB [Mycobacterium alsense]
MKSRKRTWISPQAYVRLQRELASLREARDARDKAADDNPAVARAWKTRMRRIHELLEHADVGVDPPDDGIAEPGMVLTIRYDDTGDVETFLLGVRDAEHGDMEVYSIHSPLGAAISGARPGERRSYTLPSGATLDVTLLKAVPYGIHASEVSRV